MLAPPLADFLRARRTDCNARFAAARRRWPRLGADDFSLFLRDQLSPLALALGESAPSHAPAVLTAAYDLGLQLVAEKLAGPSASHPLGNALWTDLFPRVTHLVATAPRRLLGSLVNAACQITAHPETRANDWLARLGVLAPACASADHLLALAQVLAWRAGLAHYRASALAAADTLPPPLALDALNSPAGLGWPHVRAAHAGNLWFGYNENRIPLEGLALKRRVGAFRGFGGLFLVPPLVTRSHGSFLVRSGEEAWILVADAFGATFHRAMPDEIAAASPISEPPARSVLLPSGHRPLSTITVGVGHAATSSQSYSVWIAPLLAA